MTLSISSLLAPITRDQSFANMVSMLVTIGVPADKWIPGGVASSILRVVANTFADASVVVSDAIGAGFIETSAGGWLTVLAKQVYGVDRIPATFADGQLKLVNGGGGTFSFAAGEASFLNPSTKTTYVNVAPFSLAALETKTIDIQATVAGDTGSSVPGGITQIVTAMLGATCSNPLSVIGQDAESDLALQGRCIAKLGAMSVRGPRNAYLYAVSVAVLPGGGPVNINRVRVVADSHDGHISVYVASPSGLPTSDDVTGCANSIEAIARPDGIAVSVGPVSVVTYAPTVTAWCRSVAGLNVSTIAAAIGVSVADFISNYPIGGVTTSDGRGLFASGIDGAVRAADASIVAVTGATDLALTASQVATNGVVVNVRLTS